MADEVIGRAFVEVLPDLRRLGREMRRGMATATRTSMGDVDKEVRRGFDQTGRGPGGKDAGERQGRAFRSSFAAAIAGIGESVRSRLAETSRSTQDSLSRVATAHRQVGQAAEQSAKSERAVIQARQQVQAATLAQERAALRLTSAQQRLDQVTKSSKASDDAKARATLAVRDAQLNAERAATRGAAANDRLAAAQSRAASSSNDMDRGARRGSQAIDNLNRTTQLARFGLSGLALAGAAIGPALIPAAGAMLSLGAAVGAAAGTLAVLPVLASAAAQGLGTMFAAFRGIGDAVKALGKAETTGAADSQAAAAVRRAGLERIREATNAVSTAQRNADRTAQQGAEQVAAAARRVADVREQAAGRVADAERDLADAQRSAKVAQDRLNEAREEARERLEDLALTVRGAALDERDAVLDLERARKALAESKAPAGSLEQRELALAAERAALRIEEVRERSADLRKEAAEGARAGVEGDRQVIAAKDGVTEANRRTADAERTLRQTRTEAARDVAEAQTALAQAQRDATQANADAARAVSEAQRELSNAYATSAAQSSKLSASQQALATAMDNLSPAGRRFALFLHGTMLPALKGIGDAAATAFLPPLQTALTRLLVLTPLVSAAVTSTGKAMGGLAIEGAKMATSGPWRADFATLARGNVGLITTFGRSGLQLADAFRHITLAALPMTQRFADATLKATTAVAAFFAAKRESGELGRFFTLAGDTASKLGQVVANVGVGLFNTFRALVPSGQGFLDWLIKVSASFRSWSEQAGPSGGPGKFAAFMQTAMPQVTATLQAVGAAVGNIAKAATGLAPASLATIRLLALAIANIPTKVLTVLIGGLIAVNIATKAVALTTSVYRGVLVVWTGVTKAAAAAQVVAAFAVRAVGLAIRFALGPIGIAITVIGLLTAGVIWAYKNVGWFRTAVDTSFRLIAEKTSWMWNAVMKPVFRAMVDVFLGVVGSFVTGAAKAFGWVPGIGGKLRGASAEFNRFRDDVNRALAGVRNKTVGVSWSIRGVGAQAVAYSRSGGKIFAADGGIVRFADGAENHVAQIARPGTMRMWAEPETGGEAYIPLAASKRQRSTRILGAVAGRFGLGLTPMANGGLLVRPGATGVDALEHAMASLDRGLGRVATNIGRTIAANIERSVTAGVGAGAGTWTGGGSPHRRVRWRGHQFNERTVKMLVAAERLVGRLHITQGSYSTRVRASGGTHSGGGAVDIGSPTSVGVQSALRKVGFAAWIRTPAQGPWGRHIHGIALGDPTASPSAKRQMAAFRRGGSGLGMARGGLLQRADSGGLLMPGQTAINMTRRPELMTPTGTPIRLHPDDLARLAGQVNITIRVENHGVIASQREADNWLATALDRARRRGRLSGLVATTTGGAG